MRGQSYSGRIAPRRRTTIDLRVTGRAGEPLTVEAEFPGSAPVPGAGDGVPPARTSGDVQTTGSMPPENASGSASRRDAATSARDGRAPRQLRSALPLQPARTAPLTTDKLREHLGRLGDSGYVLGAFRNALKGDVILPIGELNRLRRELTRALDAARAPHRMEHAHAWPEILAASEPAPLVPGAPGAPERG